MPARSKVATMESRKSEPRCSLVALPPFWSLAECLAWALRQPLTRPLQGSATGVRALRPPLALLRPVVGGILEPAAVLPVASSLAREQLS
jgi:hypothetical protein